MFKGVPAGTPPCTFIPPTLKSGSSGSISPVFERVLDFSSLGMTVPTVAYNCGVQRRLRRITGSWSQVRCTPWRWMLIRMPTATIAATRLDPP